MTGRCDGFEGTTGTTGSNVIEDLGGSTCGLDAGDPAPGTLGVEDLGAQASK